MGRTACTEPQCLYSRAIPLLPLWTVRPLHSLSACTVQLYLYSPYGPYGLYRASVPVQYSYTSPPPMGRTPCTKPQCLYSRAIPLLPLWAVRPVQNLSACTRVHFTFSFTTSDISNAKLIKRMDNFHITTDVIFAWDYVKSVGIERSNSALLVSVTTNFCHALIKTNVKQIPI